MGAIVVSAEMLERRVAIAQAALMGMGLTPEQWVAATSLVYETGRQFFVQGCGYGGVGADEALQLYDRAVAAVAS